MIRFKHWEGPLGRMLFTAQSDRVTGVYFVGQKHQAVAGADWVQHDCWPLFATLTDQLEEYFRGERTAFELHLAPRGTPFQQRVWDALLEIPCGRTTSYGALAGSIGMASSVRAVGAAVGRNPISIIIPCHRVVGADGSLTGYAGGLERKRALLRLEQGDAASTSPPTMQLRLSLTPSA